MVDTAAQTILSLQDRLDTTLANVSQLAISGDRQLNERGAELHTLLTDATQTIEQAHEVLGDLRTVTSSRATTRSNIESTLRDLSAAAASLRGFANDVEHNPQLLLTGRRP
jgi:paraquat-inducible protein B